MSHKQYHLRNSSILFDEDSIHESPSKNDEENSSQILFNRSNNMKSSMMDSLKQVFSPLESNSKNPSDSLFQSSTIAVPALSPLTKPEIDFIRSKENINRSNESVSGYSPKYRSISIEDEQKSIKDSSNINNSMNSDEFRNIVTDKKGENDQKNEMDESKESGIVPPPTESQSPTKRIAFMSSIKTSNSLNDSLKRLQDLQRRSLEDDIQDLQDENSPLKYNPLGLNIPKEELQGNDQFSGPVFSSPLVKNAELRTTSIKDESNTNDIHVKIESKSESVHHPNANTKSIAAQYTTPLKDSLPDDLEEEYKSMKLQRINEDRNRYGESIASLSPGVALVDSEEDYEVPHYDYRPKNVLTSPKHVSLEDITQNNNQDTMPRKKIRQQISELLDDPEWDEINALLRSHQLCGIMDEENFSSQIKYTLKQLLESVSINENVNGTHIFSQDDLHNKIKFLNQNIVRYKCEIEKLKQTLYEKDQLCKRLTQEVDNSKSNNVQVTKLQKENQKLNNQLIQQSIQISENESTIQELKKRLQGLKAEDTKALEEAQAIYKQFVENLGDGKRIRQSKSSNDKLIRVIKAYEDQRKQMNEQIHSQRLQIQSLNQLLAENKNDRLRTSGETNPVDNSAVVDSSGIDWRSKYRKLKSETDTNIKTLTLLVEQITSVKSNLEDDNKKMLQELRNRPSELDFEKLRIDFDQLKEKYDYMYRQSILKEKKVLNIQPAEWNRVPKHPDQSRSEFLLKQICELLKISDKDLIITSIKKIQTVVDAVPQLQKFVFEVCQTVQRGVDILGPHQYSVSPKDVITQINKWIGSLQYIENRQL